MAPDPLDERQRSALAVLAKLVQPGTYLGGGTAVACHLRHRISRDLDLFHATAEPLGEIDQLAGPTAAVRILNRAPGTLHLEVDGVPASLLRYRYPMLAPPVRVANVALPVAAIDDLVCMKLSAIAGRGMARDFWDLHAMLTTGRQPLAEALDAYGRKYAAEDIGHLVRSLVYFADAQGGPLPNGLDAKHWRAMQRDFEGWVRAL